MNDDQEKFPILEDKYQVPERHQNQCIRNHHVGPVHGHHGITKTIEAIQRDFAFPQMEAKVTAKAQECCSY
jgi:hypothetical protein